MNGGELQPLGMIPTKASLATRVYMMATRFWGSLSSYKPINIYIYTGWWFGTCFIFHFIYGIILPIDFHFFQDGYCTTNQYIYIYTTNA